MTSQEAAAKSAADFRNVVWPSIAPHIGGGTITQCERSGHESAQLLDIESGIDWLHRDNANQVRGIASRVQWIPVGRKPYNSFTIRCRLASGGNTEADKRLRQIRNGSQLMPELTIQAYVREGEKRLICAGLISTLQLFDFYQSARFLPEFPAPGGNKFKVVHWSHLSVGRGLKIIRPCQRITSPQLSLTL